MVCQTKERYMKQLDAWLKNALVQRRFLEVTLR
jgi:hypothetical protein